jgi:hypothetical protein
MQYIKHSQADSYLPFLGCDLVMASLLLFLGLTAKLNKVDPQAWLADVLARIASHPAHRLDELLPWNWTPRASAKPAHSPHSPGSRGSAGAVRH